MKRILFALLILLAALTGCKSPATDERPVITVSILPLQYFANQLAGDYFRINVLVPPGANHHNYDPAPKQLKDLEQSKVLFINGHLGFEETWVPKMMSNYPKLVIVDLSLNVSLINVEGGEGGALGEADHHEEEGDHHHEGVDPHYWMSVREGAKIAASMASAMIEADPGCRATVQANLQKLTAQLERLQQELEGKLTGQDRKSFIIFHPALAYFARDFNFVQYSMEQAGKEPAAAHFRELVDLARKENINTIFIQKEYDQENAQTFARETGSKIVTIDPMSPDWFEEISSLAGKLREMDQR